jgi:DNA-binding NarL/FixJ family response regulator
MPRQQTQGPITVVIVDDHRSFGEALEVALDKELDLSVIEVVTDGEAAIETAAKEHPDVVLMDLQMPGVDGIEATRRIHEEATGTVVIILSGQSDDVSLARAIQAGARGYLRKTEAVGGVADAIRRAHRGEPLHTSGEVEESLRKLRRRRAMDGNLAQRIDRLTPRETEILQRMADGDPPEKIANDLSMSKHTLRTHTQNVLTKLGVHSKLDAIVAAIRYGKISTVEVSPDSDIMDLIELDDLDPHASLESPAAETDAESPED